MDLIPRAEDITIGDVYSTVHSGIVRITSLPRRVSGAGYGLSGVDVEGRAGNGALVRWGECISNLRRVDETTAAATRTDLDLGTFPTRAQYLAACMQRGISGRGFRSDDQPCPIS